MGDLERETIYNNIIEELDNIIDLMITAQCNSDINLDEDEVFTESLAQLEQIKENFNKEK